MSERRWSRDASGRAPPPAPVDLEPLDPRCRDAGYWLRFERRVMSAALPGLARRARSTPTGVSDVVEAWSRLLVPVAAVAAGVGAFLVTEATDGSVAPWRAVAPEPGVEVEAILLPGEEDGGQVPAFLVSEGTADEDVVQFAIEHF